jgi:microcystin-dependent protein
MIMMWSGTIATIPSGWLLCDGTNGTPDLRDKFVIGASVDSGGQSVTTVTGANTKTGGSKDAVVVSHTHTASVTDPGHSHTFIGGDNAGGGFYTASGARLGVGNVTSTASIQTATTGISVSNSTTGVSGTNANLTPYLALAFIMKA